MQSICDEKTRHCLYVKHSPLVKVTVEKKATSLFNHFECVFSWCMNIYSQTSLSAVVFKSPLTMTHLKLLSEWCE